MNIIYISADFGVPFFGYRGACIHLREMVNALCKAGHSVRIFSPALEETEGEKGRRGEGENFMVSPIPPFPVSPFRPNSPSGTDNENVSFLHVLPQEFLFQLYQELEALHTFLGMKTRIRQELRNLFYNLRLYEKALDDLRSRRVDFIYERYTLFSFAGIRLARALDVPHILEVNAPLAYEQEKTRGLEMKEFAREAERRIFRETDRVIVVSRRLQEFVASCGVPASRIHVLPNAVDPSRFVSADDGKAIRVRYHLHGKRVIGFVGSLKPWHGTETLLEAFRALYATAPNTHLLIVGDGPKREGLEQYARSNGLNGAVTFTGNVPYDDIPHYIATMDITVAPYIPNENFYYSPIKIFEYMVMGKPVVAGRIGQVEELIADGETGVLFEPGNVGQLTAALARLTDDVQLCRHLGEKASAWVQKERTWDNNAREVIAIAQELIERSKT
jgi:glycosyltransferase involved in cell wall biosynthesis